MKKVGVKGEEREASGFSRVGDLRVRVQWMFRMMMWCEYP